jgi:GTP-binding protein
LLNATFFDTVAALNTLPRDSQLEAAFAGRSNAGKSSAINAILGRRDFARTSKTPGRTQLVNFFALADGQRLVDLPGYGFARVSHETREHWRALLDGYFRRRRSLRGLMLVVDSRRGMGEGDGQMLEWAQALHCPVHVLLTKADKLSRREVDQAFRAATDELGTAATAQMFSATAKLGVDEARARLAAMLVESTTE